MEKYKCFLVDDEPLALHVIEQHLSRFSQFEICGKSTDPIEALSLIKTLHPDLLFLDIQMPEITGLELIESMDQKPDVIITTAYRDFAVDGFDLNVLDYLVKPIPFKRFVKAIDKFLESRQSKPFSAPGCETDHIYVKADRKTVRIQLSDIQYVEGVKDYVKIVLADHQIVTKVTIGNFLKEIPDGLLVQVHKSFLIAKSKITAYTAHDVEIGKKEIPIGRMYKEAFIKEMGG